ncbi:MAG TPA: hypothetical protein VE010_06745 [Thermoanaerobaculia bacterium]|nr:hypothetical protein [Thermoanaerobaculia bacterium]
MPSLPDDAAGRGVEFLRRVQLPTGELPVLASGQPDPSVYPTAVMAYSLSFVPAANDVRERALDYLAAEMQEGAVWKHWPRTHPQHDFLLPDLDDTACASAELTRARRTIPDNRALLLKNRNRHGLFRTWLLRYRHPLAMVAFFTRTSAKPFDADAVVNANVLFYLGDVPVVVEHLLAVLREDRERHCDKWYDNPFVVWYFFARALQSISGEGCDLIAKKIAAATPSNALEHALAACALHMTGRTPDVAALLRTQLPTGAWPAAPVYHGGRARKRDGTFGEPHPDTPYWGSEAWTTAFALEALALLTA